MHIILLSGVIKLPASHKVHLLDFVNDSVVYVSLLLMQSSIRCERSRVMLVFTRTLTDLRERLCMLAQSNERVLLGAEDRKDS